jgi:hypothetical protein
MGAMGNHADAASTLKQNAGLVSGFTGAQKQKLKDVMDASRKRMSELSDLQDVAFGKARHAGKTYNNVLAKRLAAGGAATAAGINGTLLSYIPNARTGKDEGAWGNLKGNLGKLKDEIVGMF